MIINQANLHAMAVGYNTLFNMAFAETPSGHEEIATVVPSTTGEQSYNWLGQMPEMREWIGEREKQAISAYDYVIKNKHFEMTVSVNRDSVEDDNYGVFNPLFKNMGICAAEHPAIMCYGLLKDGFKKLCYDEKPFFSTEHPVGKKKISNMGTKKLSLESYIEARTTMMQFFGDKGKSLRIIPDKLVVSSANEEMGKRILESEIINGSSNTYKGTAKLVIEPLLDETPNAWFLLCTTKGVKPIIYQERTKIKFVNMVKEDDNNVFMNNEFIYGADGRNNAGYGFWQMAYGSTGAVAE